MKHLLAVLTTLACLLLALLPEIVMVGLYNYIEPATSFEKIFTIGMFGLVGGGACFVSALLALAIWVELIDAIYLFKKW